jgi:hypothetical protein
MRGAAIIGIAAVAVVFACSGSSDLGPAGGPVSGPADLHCSLPDGGTRAQPLDPSTCHASVPDGSVAADYGPTLYNSESDDDDCKYHVKFSSTPIYENTNVTFTVTATQKADGGVATGANVVAEVFLNSTHPAPNTNQSASESPAGTYKVGPIQFDQKGQWTVRFHLHEDCEDVLEDSPHGHVAFFIAVP